MRSSGNLAVSALAANGAEQRAEAQQLAGLADLIEYRLDKLLQTDGLEELLSSSPRPCIATCRRPQDGGDFRADEGQRRALLQRASQVADWVDLELDVLPAWRPTGPARLIVSHHDFGAFPDIRGLLRQLLASGGIAKLAVRTQELSQVLEVMALQRAHPRCSLLIGMGDVGSLSRISGAANGAFLGFGAGTSASGPGQIPLRAMRNQFRFGSGPDPLWSLVGLLPPASEHLAGLNTVLAAQNAARLVVPLPYLPDDPQAAQRAGFDVIAADPRRLLYPEPGGWREVAFERKALLQPPA